MGDRFSKKIGNLIIRGEFLADKDGFNVTVDYAGVCLVKDETLDKRNNTYPFSYIPPGASEYAARGLLCYCKDSFMKIPELFAALSAPVGVNIKLYPVGVVPSPPHPPKSSED